MVGDNDDSDFSGDAFASPGEVAGVEAQSAVFSVAATGTDEMDSLAADAGVGWLTTFLEGSVMDGVKFCVPPGSRMSLCGGMGCTFSCGSMRALHQWQTAYGGCLVRYP